jgi:TonB family protein
MYYPPTAQAISKEGLVVVNLKLDMDGNVVDAEALSGSVPLVRDSLDNSRKWRFKPNSQKAAVLVYNYRIVGMCLDNTEPAQFKLDQPNFVSVTGCAKRNVD